LTNERKANFIQAMPMNSAISNFQDWRERQQARHDREQVATEEDVPTHPLQVTSGSEDGASSPASAHSTTPMIETLSSEDETDVENPATGDSDQNATETTPVVRSSRRTFTLADLEEERESARRKTSFCVLFSIFILFRLWIQAVTTGDFFLLMICLMGTSWTARFIRHSREREEEIDRMIAEYNNNDNAEGDLGMSRNDLQRLSFQAQLAMAIINSQRDMMQGGFGNSDGGSNSPGVSDETMEQWDRFAFKPDAKGYGSRLAIDVELATKGPHSKEEDEPHCSICLGEYEEAEKLVCLPCKHIYHEECISSWCANHVRCPLCNLDLETVASDEDSTTIATVASS